MWTFIILVIVGFLIKFFYDMNKQKTDVAKQGGMQQKYKVLVKHLLSGDPRATIYELILDD